MGDLQIASFCLARGRIFFVWFSAQDVIPLRVGALRRDHMSIDMVPAYPPRESARKEHHAVTCYDPFHVVQLVTTALDKVRRSVWQDLRELPDQEATKRLKGARWALLENPVT